MQNNIILQINDNNIESIATLEGAQSNCGELSHVCLALDRFAVFSDRILNDLLLFIESSYSSCGYLGRIVVDKSERGQGLGQSLIDDFKKIVKDCDIVFLFARLDTPQKEGFSLLEFYKKNGFSPIMKSNGETLMVSTEKAKEIEDFIFHLN